MADKIPASREDLLIASERMRAALSFIAGHVTSDEGSTEQTEADFGLDVAEVIEMAHDNMIERARSILNDAAVIKAVGKSP